MNRILTAVIVVVIGVAGFFGYRALQPSQDVQIGATLLFRSQGGTASQSYDPNDDRIYYWNDTAGYFKWLDIGTNLSISGNTLNAIGGVAGGTNSNIAFLTVGNTSSLSYERSLTATAPLVFTDGGVNSTYNLGLSAGYSIGLTASQSAWEVLKDGGPYLTGNQTITLTGGVTGFGATSIATTVASESFWDLAYAYRNIGHLPLAGGTLTGTLFGTSASLSANLEVGGFASISNAGYFKLPWGTAPTVDANGKLAVDDSGFGQLVYYASGSVHTLTDEYQATISLASTSFNTFASRSLGFQFRGATIKRIWCKVSSATSVVINLSANGTTDMDTLTCTTSGVSDDGSIANSTVAKGNELYLERKTVTGEADWLTITYTYTKTRE